MRCLRSLYIGKDEKPIRSKAIFNFDFMSDYRDFSLFSGLHIFLKSFKIIIFLFDNYKHISMRKVN